VKPAPGALPRRQRASIAGILLALAVSIALPISAQVPAPTSHGTSAPTQPGAKSYAQDLVDRLLVRHPELSELDIHATPPNESQSVIIASKTPGRIGKKSDLDDLEVFKTGTPRLEINPAGQQNVEVALQLQDNIGHPVGVIEMTFPYVSGFDRDALILRADKLKDELRRRVADHDNLFEPAQFDVRVPTDTYGQFIVDDTLSNQPEIAVIVMHVKSPQGDLEYPIVGSNIGRIGKPADESDLNVIRTGTTVLALNPAGDRLEAKLPLQDVSGEVIGAVAVVFRYRALNSEAALGRQAEKIRDQLRRRIASAANTYEPYPYRPSVLTDFPAKSYAQQLVDQAVAKNPDLLILSIHASPEGGTDYPIIASNVGRIGKKADERIAKVIETGQPVTTPSAEAAQRIEVAVRLQDRAGKTVGAITAVYPYKQGDSESVALKKAEDLAQEIGKQTPSLVALAQPVRPLQSEYDKQELGNAQSLPMTKAVVSGQKLADSAQDGYSEAVKNVAGVSPANSVGSPNDSINIRGIKLNLFSNYRLNGGLPTAGVISSPTENKERIETLKGANALMFGVASPAGIINLVTKRAGEFDVSTVSYAGNGFGQYGFAVDIGRRFGPEREAGARVNLSTTELQNGVRGMGGRGSFGSIGFDWRITDRLSFQYDYEQYSKNVPEQGGISLASAVNGVVPITRVPDPRNLLSGTWAEYTPRTSNAQGRFDFIINDQWKVLAEAGSSDSTRSRFTVRIGNYNLQTGANGTVTVNPVTQNYINNFRRVESLGKFNFGPVTNDLTFGVSQSERDAATPNQNSIVLPQKQNIYDPIVLLPPVPTKPDTSLPLQTSKDTGVYVYDTMGIFPGWKLLLGVRRTKDDENNGVKQSSSTVNTPAYGVLWDIRPTTTLFASYMQGLEAGATAPVSAVNAYAILPPAVSTQKEIGVRDSYVKGLSISGSYFDISRANGVTNPVTHIFQNEGVIDYKGVEATMNWTISPIVSLNGSLMWLQAVQNAPIDPLINGLTPENTPKWIGNMSVTFRVPQLPGFSINGGVSGVSQRPVNPQDQGYIPGYALYSAGVSYVTTFGGHRTSLQLNVSNLSNRRYWNSVQTGTYGIGMDRTIRLNAKYDF
jgi:iron complex outermembrane receptor protein